MLDGSRFNLRPTLGVGFAGVLPKTHLKHRRKLSSKSPRIYPDIGVVKRSQERLARFLMRADTLNSRSAFGEGAMIDRIGDMPTPMLSQKVIGLLSVFDNAPAFNPVIRERDGWRPNDRELENLLVQRLSPATDAANCQAIPRAARTTGRHCSNDEPTGGHSFTLRVPMHLQHQCSVCVSATSSTLLKWRNRDRLVGNLSDLTRAIARNGLTPPCKFLMTVRHAPPTLLGDHPSPDYWQERGDALSGIANAFKGERSSLIEEMAA